jgi:hypothetical protein
MRWEEEAELIYLAGAGESERRWKLLQDGGTRAVSWGHQGGVMEKVPKPSLDGLAIVLIVVSSVAL